MSDLVPYGRGRLDKRAGRALDRIEERTALARKQDQAQAVLTAARVSDLQRVTRHGLMAATTIGVEFEMQAACVESPFVHRALAQIAQTGMRGIKSQIDDLADPLA